MSTMVLPALGTPTMSRPHLRLTRRGRLVVFLAGLLLAVAVAVAFAGVSFATAEKGEPVPTDVVVVGTGVTLWDIASARAEDGDVRGMISTIQELNRLDGGLVTAGQRLRVPATDPTVD